MQAIKVPSKPVLLLIVLLFAFGVSESLYFFSKPVSDFGNYFFGALFSINGDTYKDVYDVYSFNQHVATTGIRNFFLDHTSVPPQTVLFYIPFTLCGDVFLAKAIFNIVGIFFLSISLYRLYIYLNPENTLYWAAGLLLCLFPVHYNILTGQTYLFITALIIESFLSFKKKKLFMSAFMLGVCISLKLFPIIFLLPFLLAKNYRYILLTTLSCVIILVLSIPLVGLDTIALYYGHLLPRILSGFVNDPYSVSYQGIQTLLRVALTNDEALNPVSVSDNSTTIMLILHALSFFFVFSLLLSTLAKDKEIQLRYYFICILPVLFLSGYSASYSYILPVLLFSASSNPGIKTNISFLLLCLLAIFPNNLLGGESYLLAFYKVYIGLSLFLLQINFRLFLKPTLVVATISALFFIIRFINTDNTVPVRYFNYSALKQDYIFDFKHTDSNFTAYFWNPKGSSDSITIPYSVKGKTLTGSSGIQVAKNNVLVKNPVQFGDSVVFLSDYNRGVGLYNIFILSEPDYQKFTGRYPN